MKNKVEIDKQQLLELELLASVPQLADNSILIIDKEGSILWTNLGFERLYGYSLNEYKVKQADDHANFIQVVGDTDRNFFKKNPSFSFSRSIINNKGIRKWIQSTVTAVKNANDSIEKYIVIETDITQQKEMEEDLIQRWENTQTLTEHLESVKSYVEEQISELNEQKKALELAKDRSEEVLNKVLPYEVAIQLKKKGYATPRHYKKVSVLNLNIRNFFHLSDIIPIEDLVEQLHESLVTFDNILEAHFIEKIKMAGSIYLGAGGVPLRNKSNPIDAVLAGLEIQHKIVKINEHRNQMGLPVFKTAIGIHSGKVIAGVVGKNKLSYDIWGDTVNIACTIENNIPEGKLVISESTFSDISEFFDCAPLETLILGTAEALKLYEVIRIKQPFSKDTAGVFPNHEFIHILSKL